MDSTTTHTTAVEMLSPEPVAEPVAELVAKPVDDQSTKKTLTCTTGMNKCLLKNTYKYTTKSGEEVVLNLTNANVARPHVCAVAGATLRSELTSCTSVFTFEYLSRPPKSSDTHPTEIFVPHVHYPTGYRVTASDGHCIVEKHEGYDIIRHQPDKHDHKHELVVERITMKKQPKTPAVGLHGHSNMPVYVALGMAVVAPFMA